MTEELQLTNANDRLVFEAMKRLVCATRELVCAATDLPRTTAYDALMRLGYKNLVVPFRQNLTPGRGTPNTVYMITPQVAQLTTKEWRRMTQTIYDVHLFFSGLDPEDRIFCRIQGESVFYREVSWFCKNQCGVRIACMHDNQDGTE